MNRIYVAGTDTGVGKTVLSLLVMQFFLRRGDSPFYLKPLQTGCARASDPESDAAFIYRHVASLKGRDPSDSVVYCFRNPKAPLFAARDEGKTIDLDRVDAVVREKGRQHLPLVIEGAGGLLVPATEGRLMVDMIDTTGAIVILAARAGLGTINHTLMSLEAMGRRGITPAGIVFLNPEGVPAEMVSQNREAVETFSGIRICGVIGNIGDFSHPPESCYDPLRSLFDR